MFYRPGKRFFSLRGFELLIMCSIFSGVFGLPYMLAILLVWLSVKRKMQSDAGEIKSKEDIIERFQSACNETTQLEIEKLYLPIVMNLSLTRDS